MFRFTIRDVLWLMVVVAVVLWSEMRLAKRATTVDAERAALARRTAMLEGDARKWKGRAGAVAQTMRNLGIPVTFNEETIGMLTGPIPAYFNPPAVSRAPAVEVE